MGSEFDSRPNECVSSGFAANAEPIVFGPLEEALTNMTPEEEYPVGEAGESALSDTLAYDHRDLTMNEPSAVGRTPEPDLEPQEEEVLDAGQSVGAEAPPEELSADLSPSASPAPEAAEPRERVAEDAGYVTPDAEFSREQHEPTIVRVATTDGRVSQVTETYPSERGAVLGHLKNLRTALTDSVPESAKFEDLDMDAFFEAKGLETAPVYVLTRDQIADLADDLQQRGFDPAAVSELVNLGAAPNSKLAASISELGAAIVVDNKFTASDPALKGYIVAHERAHLSDQLGEIVLRIDNGAGSYNFVRMGQSVNVVRPGQPVQNRGAFLEEAFGASMGVEYIRDSLGFPNGAWDNPLPKEASNGIYLPPAYVWPVMVGTEEGSKQGTWVDKAAYAGFALDLLKQAVPTLADSTIQARSSVQGLRDVARGINKVRPGLYSELQKLPSTLVGFRAGLLAVQNALDMTAWDVF